MLRQNRKQYKSQIFRIRMSSIGGWILFCILLFCVIVSFVVYSLGICSIDEFGVLGDYVGGIIGTIVGLIGIIFLYRTYRLQIRIFEKQDKRLCQQQFESAFFILLSQQRNLLQNMRGNLGKDDESVGSQYISQLRKDLSLRLRDLGYEPERLDLEDANGLKVQVNDIYQELFQSNVAQLGHYFRHLYHILKYIEESEIDDKKKYCDLVQAQMSTDELYVTAINGISNYGRKRMLPLLNKYSFLENLVIDDDPIVASLIPIFYPQTKRKNIYNMERNIIFVGGVHAVGKSFFSDMIKQDNPSIVTLSCSDVLKWQDATEKEVEDVVANQDRLMVNLQKMIDIDKPYILDGHFCLINTQGEIERVPLSVFQSINPGFIILLVEEPSVIARRLKRRDRKEYGLEELQNLLREERLWALEVAANLGVPIYEIKASEYEKVRNYVEEFVQGFAC